MKSALLVPVVALVLATGAQAQKGSIWRCGNTYTNDAAEAKAKGCKLMEGGNVTVVEGTKVQGANAAKGGSGSDGVKLASRASKTDEQKARDADARAILEAELKKAEARRADLLKEYNNGDPEKLGPEHRNHQKYLDRVAALKEGIARADSDIAGIRRELGRMAGSDAGGTVPATR